MAVLQHLLPAFCLLLWRSPPAWREGRHQDCLLAAPPPRNISPARPPKLLCPAHLPAGLQPRSPLRHSVLHAAALPAGSGLGRLHAGRPPAERCSHSPPTNACPPKRHCRKLSLPETRYTPSSAVLLAPLAMNPQPPSGISTSPRQLRHVHTASARLCPLTHAPRAYDDKSSLGRDNGRRAPAVDSRACAPAHRQPQIHVLYLAAASHHHPGGAPVRSCTSACVVRTISEVCRSQSCSGCCSRQGLQNRENLRVT